MRRDYPAKAQSEVEALIAMGLYQIRVNAIRDRIRELYETYKDHLKPIGDVREILAEEIPEEERLSEEIAKLRKAETH